MRRRYDPEPLDRPLQPYRQLVEERRRERIHTRNQAVQQWQQLHPRTRKALAAYAVAAGLLRYGQAYDSGQCEDTLSVKTHPPPPAG